MASLSKNPQDMWRIQWKSSAGKRLTLWLGKASTRDANATLRHVDELIEASKSHRGCSRETVAWLEGCSAGLLKRLCKAGLVELKISKPKPTFSDLAQVYQARGDIGDSTKSIRRYWESSIVTILGNKPSDQITPDDAELLRDALLQKGLKKVTVGRMLRFARQVLEIAVSKKHITENPMAGLKHNFREGKAAPREYICPNRVEEILRVMPGPWRMMTALARFAGLRSPSESLLLRWSDVYLDEKCPYLHVTSPKTASQGKAWRNVPISPRLAEILREGKPGEVKPSDFVVDLPAYRKPRKGGWHGVNTRQQYNKILVKSGIGLIKNAFKVFRSSCVTDWARDHAVHVVAAWAGHTVGVAGKHYLTLTDSDWVKATSSATTLSSSVTSTVLGVSPTGQAVGNFRSGNPEDTRTSVTQKVTQKVTYPVQEMVGNNRNNAEGQKSQVVNLPEVTDTCLILPDISIYPARIRT